MVGAGCVVLWLGMSALWGVEHLPRPTHMMLGGIRESVGMVPPMWRSLQKFWAYLVGGFVFLWSPVEIALGWLGTADLVITHYQELGWMAVPMTWLLNPPLWALLLSPVLGAAIISWQFWRTRRYQPPSATLSENQSVERLQPKKYPFSIRDESSMKMENINFHDEPTVPLFDVSGKSRVEISGLDYQSVHP